MKGLTFRTKATVLAAALQLAGLAVVPALAAQSPEVLKLFPSQPSGYVTDAAHLLQSAESQEMEGLILRLKDVTGAEIAVVTLPTIDDRSEAEVALAIGRTWGVGAKGSIGDSARNAGIVLLLVPRQNHKPGTGKVRIEVGRGLEGIVTDARAGMIRRDVMGPLLAKEEYGPALVAGVQALVGQIAQGFGVSDSALTAYAPRPQPSGNGRGSPLLSLLPLIFIIFFIVLGSFGRRGRRRGIYWGGPWIGGGFGGGGGWGGGGGGGFGGFGGGGGFSGGGSGGSF